MICACLKLIAEIWNPGAGRHVLCAYRDHRLVNAARKENV